MEAAQWHNDFTQLMTQGGYVLWVILFATLLLWWLIIERYLFFRFSFPRWADALIERWQTEQAKNKWEAKAKRQFYIAQTAEHVAHSLTIIRTLTVILPMLGLLGTVAGMIETFDVMSVVGTGNIRGMANGISQALITTMAGLVGALSGMYFSANLEERSALEKQKLADQFDMESLGEMRK